jgi:hypothetical protein
MIRHLQYPIANSRLTDGALPLISDLATGVTSAKLVALADWVRIPATVLASASSLGDAGLQNTTVDYITGFLQTDLDIIASVSQVLAVATNNLPGTAATTICPVAGWMDSVSGISTEFQNLTALLPQLASALGMCSLLSKCETSHNHSRSAGRC